MTTKSMFRDLSAAEAEEFRSHARSTFVLGDEIVEVWHPIYREECEDMEQEVLTFLDDLRKSGVTNMFGAGQHLQKKFVFYDKDDASQALIHWMETFAERHPTGGK